MGQTFDFRKGRNVLGHAMSGFRSISSDPPCARALVTAPIRPQVGDEILFTSEKGDIRGRISKATPDYSASDLTEVHIEPPEG